MTRIRCTVGQRRQEAKSRKQEGGLPHGNGASERAGEVSEMGDCRKKTRKQAPVTTRRPAFYFCSCRTEALALALRLHLHLLILPASPLSRGKWQLSLILATCRGASHGLRGLHLGALGPHRRGRLRVTVLHSAANMGSRRCYDTHPLLTVCLPSIRVKIAVSRLHGHFSPLCLLSWIEALDSGPFGNPFICGAPISYTPIQYLA